MMMDNRVLMAALMVRDYTGPHKMPTYLCCIENQANKNVVLGMKDEGPYIGVRSLAFRVEEGDLGAK